MLQTYWAVDRSPMPVYHEFAAVVVAAAAAHSIDD